MAMRHRSGQRMEVKNDETCEGNNLFVVSNGITKGTRSMTFTLQWWRMGVGLHAVVVDGGGFG